MAPRWFQEPSWPLLVALGPLWGLLRAILGRREAILGRSWGDLGASWRELGTSWGDLGRNRVAMKAKKSEGKSQTRGGAAVLAHRVAPPRDFLQKVSAFKGLEITTMIRDVHKGLSTRRAALGAADLERPAGETPPPPRRDVPRAGCARQLL